MLEALLGVGKPPAIVIPGGYGLFHSGNRNGSTYDAIDKYQFSDDSYLTGVSLVAARRRSQHCAIGNRTLAVFGGGNVGSGGVPLSTDTYTHASAAFGTGTNLTVQRLDSAGYGEASRGWMMSGNVGAGAVSSSQRYTYAGHVVAAGANLVGTPRYNSASGGNDTYGFVIGGRTAAAATFSVDKHTYAADTVAGATALAAAQYRGAATSVPSHAYVGGGFEGTATARVLLWNFTTEASTAGTALTVIQQEHAAAGNETKGVFAGGRVAITNVSTYTYSGNVVVAGTALPTGRHSYPGVSSSPGGFSG